MEMDDDAMQGDPSDRPTCSYGKAKVLRVMWMTAIDTAFPGVDALHVD